METWRKNFVPPSKHRSGPAPEQVAPGILLGRVPQLRGAMLGQAGSTSEMRFFRELRPVWFPFAVSRSVPQEEKRDSG
jgi:hypothetical protein